MTYLVVWNSGQKIFQTDSLMQILNIGVKIRREMLSDLVEEEKPVHLMQGLNCFLLNTYLQNNALLNLAYVHDLSPESAQEENDPVVVNRSENHTFTTGVERHEHNGYILEFAVTDAHFSLNPILKVKIENQRHTQYCYRREISNRAYLAIKDLFHRDTRSETDYDITAINVAVSNAINCLSSTVVAQFNKFDEEHDVNKLWIAVYKKEDEAPGPENNSVALPARKRYRVKFTDEKSSIESGAILKVSITHTRNQTEISCTELKVWFLREAERKFTTSFDLNKKHDLVLIKQAIAQTITDMDGFLVNQLTTLGPDNTENQLWMAVYENA